MNYRRELDGLRALALLPVILFHAGVQTFSGGFVGVDIFSVISGYLITTILLTEKATGAYTVLGFYERRARRILPALFVVMFASLPFAWLWLIPQDMRSFSQSLAAVSAFASNILFWRTSGYFNTATELTPFLQTWSLALEEQYYVLFPLFLMLTWRLGKRCVLGLLIAVAVLSLSAAEWAAYHSPTAGFFLLPTRGWELLIGAFVAFYFLKTPKPVHTPAISQAMSLVGLAMIAWAVFAFDRNTPFPSLYALAPTTGTALIILFGTPKTIVGRLLGSKPLVGIGLISYSAYLWHQPLFAFARVRSTDDPGPGLMVSLAVGAIILAYFTWRFVETPFRDSGALRADRFL